MEINFAVKENISIKLIVLLVFVFIYSLINFDRSINFEYADYDGFQYLSFSKSVLSGAHFYENVIRSPILALIILPDLVLARIEMIIFHLIAVVLVYLITYEITKNEWASLFSSLLYGVSWWMITFLSSTLSDLPAMVFFLTSLFFWIKDGKNNMFYAGIFSGLAFITRFDIAVLLLPLIVFTFNRKSKRDFLTPLFLIAVPFELLTSWFVFGRLVYPPLEFFNVNFVYGLAPALANAHDSGIFFVASKLVELVPLLVFMSLISMIWKRDHNYNKIFALTAFCFLAFSLLPTPDNRIFMVKLIPLMTILSAYSFLLIRDKFRKPLNYCLVAIICLIYIIYNLVFLFSVQYPVWKLSETPCYEGVVCTNAPPVVNYYCEKPAEDIYRFGDKHVNTNLELNKTAVILYNLEKCDHLVYYNVSFGYDDNVNELIKSKYTLEKETGFSVIYGLKEFTAFR